MNNISKARRVLILFTLLEVALIALISFKIIPFSLRFYLLILFAGLMVIYSFFTRTPIQNLGMSKQNLKNALEVNLFVTAILVGIIILAKELDVIRSVDQNVPNSGWYLLYGLVLAPLQEFIFRGFLFFQMEKSQISSKIAKILFSGLLFASIHLIYGDALTFLTALIVGIIWSYIYYLQPNLYAIAISHSIVGIIAIYLQII